MTVGITGSSGFIGGALARSLRKRRGIRVLTFDRPGGDLLGENHSKLDRFVRGCNVIVHAAAVTRGKDFDLIAGNVVATHRLLAALRRTKSKAKLVFLSSSVVDFRGTRPVYGAAKELTERMVESFSRENRHPATIMRLTNAFGEGCRPFHNSVVATFCHQIVRGKPLEVNAKGPPLTLIYIGDVVKILVRETISKRKAIFRFRRVYTDNVISLHALARLISSFRTLRNPRILKSKFHRDLYRTYRFFAEAKR